MKARTLEGRGEERARHVTPDLSYYWEGAREKCARKINGMKKKKEEKKE